MPRRRPSSHSRNAPPPGSSSLGRAHRLTRLLPRMMPRAAAAQLLPPRLRPRPRQIRPSLRALRPVAAEAAVTDVARAWLRAVPEAVAAACPGNFKVVREDGAATLALRLATLKATGATRLPTRIRVAKGNSSSSSSRLLSNPVTDLAVPSTNPSRPSAASSTLASPS